MRQVPPGLIQAFWDGTRRQFSIPNDPEKKRVFVSLLGKRFRGFKTNLTNRWIHKMKKVHTKKKNAKEDDRPPWQIWPTVSKDDWEEFVRMKSQKKAIELQEQNQANAEKKEYVHHFQWKQNFKEKEGGEA